MNLSIDSLYEQFLPNLQTLEQERMVLYKRLQGLKRNVILAGLVVTVIAGIVWSFWVIIPVGIIGLVIYTILYHNSIGSYRKNYKSKIFKELVSVLGNEFSYDFNGRIDIDEFRQSGLFHPFTKLTCEDLIKGTFDGYSFEMAEADLYWDEVKSSGNKGSSNSYIFKGLFFAGTMPFSFPTKIWILSEHGPKVHHKSRKQDDWAQVDMTDMDFEEEYDVFAEDEELARKVIRPSVLQTIMELKREVTDEKNRLEISFQGNRIFISISSTKGLFEPPVRTPITDKALFRENFCFLSSTTSMLQKLTLVD